MVIGTYIHEQLLLSKSIPAGEGLFAIDIIDQGSGTFELQHFGIAEEYALFSVDPGIEFSPLFASQHIALVSNNGTDPGSAILNFTLFQSKYFAYWDDRSFGEGPTRDDNYGWAEITWKGDGLVILESVTAIGGGIIVGTTTQIPEPSTIPLLGGGSLAIYLLRSKRNRTGRINR